MISYFLIGFMTAAGNCQKIGQVANGKKLKLDAAAASFFPANTKAREEILKACRWCADGNKVTPNYVDVAVRSNTIRVIPVKVAL